jgi:arsenate reductase (thioredoxin)
MTMSDFEALRIEERLALQTAAARLQEMFKGVFGAETIQRFLMSSFDEFAPRSSVRRYLALMAERFARQRLTALARVEGHRRADEPPIVLFLCVHNAGRSQIALGWLQHLAGERAIAWSGGMDPADEQNPTVVEAMAEVGIDISSEFPKPWTDEVVRAADVVVTMGCGDACPIYPGKEYQDWNIPDLVGLKLEEMRPIRDDLGRRVRGLLDDLHVPVATRTSA